MVLFSALIISGLTIQDDLPARRGVRGEGSAMYYDKSHRLGPTLGHAAMMAKACLDARVSPYHLTPAQTHVLLYLQKNGGQAPQGELVRFMRVRPPTASAMLERMEEKGLVRRSVSGSDARRQLVTLTEKGSRQHALFQEIYLGTEETILRGFTSRETETLLSLLDRIIANLEEDRKV